MDTSREEGEPRVRPGQYLTRLLIQRRATNLEAWDRKDGVMPDQVEATFLSLFFIACIFLCIAHSRHAQVDVLL